MRPWETAYPLWGADADETTAFPARGTPVNTLAATGLPSIAGHQGREPSAWGGHCHGTCPKGDASVHACRIEQGGHGGRDEPCQIADSDPRAGAGAVKDQAELPGQQVGMAHPAPFGLGTEEGGQILFDPVGHLARRVALVFELDLSSQVPTALEVGRTRLLLQLVEDVQDPLAG